LKSKDLACGHWATRLLGRCHPGHNREFVREFTLSIQAAIRVFLRSRGDNALEVLALRQQVAVLKRKRLRPKLNSFDRLFWTTLRRGCSRLR
jgi:hypothetical protein